MNRGAFLFRIKEVRREKASASAVVNRAEGARDKAPGANRSRYEKQARGDMCGERERSGKQSGGREGRSARSE